MPLSTLVFQQAVKASEGDVFIGDTKEGTMALRLCPSLSMNSSKSGVNTGASTGHAFNSNGVRDHDIWGKHANWVCYYGPDPKENPVGVVIFSHPSNLRSPTTWHARDYGLFAVKPFGLHDFESDKPAGAGDYTIKKATASPCATASSSPKASRSPKCYRRGFWTTPMKPTPHEVQTEPRHRPATRPALGATCGERDKAPLAKLSSILRSPFSCHHQPPEMTGESVSDGFCM